MEEHDPKVAVHDRLQALRDRLRLARRLRVHVAHQRLAEVRQRRAGKASDEALCADDAELETGDLAGATRAVEHVHAGRRDDRRQLVCPVRMEVVVAENREDRHVEIAARVGDNLRLLRLAASS